MEGANNDHFRPGFHTRPKGFTGCWMAVLCMYRNTTTFLCLLDSFPSGSTKKARSNSVIWSWEVLITTVQALSSPVLNPSKCTTEP
jgi:hypothetical protein